MSVPNQKIVEIGTRTIRNGNNLYATMNLDALQQAMKTLKGSSLKMWLYFNKNQEHYAFELSRADCLEWGIKKDSYYDGVRELVEKGYLVQAREGSNYYTFYESPRTGNPNSDNQNNYFTEKPNDYSNNQKYRYGNPNELYGDPYRNNIYNTDILHNKTSFDLSEKERREKVAAYKKRLGF